MLNLIDKLKQIPTLSPDSIYVQVLSKVNILFLIFNFFFTTLSLAWTCEVLKPELLAISNIGFAICALNVLSQLIIQTEEDFIGMITNITQIAYRFLFKRNGIINIIFLFPFELFGTNSPYFVPVCQRDFNRVFALVRVIRYFANFGNLLKAFLDFRLYKLSKQITRLIKNLLVFLLMSHFSACLFWDISTTYASKYTWANTTGLVNKPSLDQYIASILAAQSALVFTRRYEKADAELIYSFLETLVALIIYGTVFGNIAVIVKNVDSGSTILDLEKIHKYKLKNMKHFMANTKFQPSLQDTIINHEKHKFITTNGIDESKIFLGLPKTIRQEIANHLYLEAIRKVTFLKDADENFLQRVAMVIKPIVVLKGNYVFEKNDQGTEMYFISSGQVDILGANNFKICSLKAGCSFGEIAIVEGIPRTASARAGEDTELFVLSKMDFELLLDEVFCL